jgi:predicted nucleic acid-binding protein
MEDAKAGQVLTFLLDTNVLSELRKARPHGGVLAWFTANQASASFATPAIALFELQAGVEKLRQQDSARAEKFDFWADRIVDGSNILPLDAAAAREAARLMSKQSTALLFDAMIAAIARVNGYTVATRNTRDFEHFEVPLVNPFLYQKD